MKRIFAACIIIAVFGSIQLKIHRKNSMITLMQNITDGIQNALEESYDDKDETMQQFLNMEKI